MSKKKLLASTLLSMSYGELAEIANEMVDMQKSAREDGWAWEITEVHGEYGMLRFLHNWADSAD